MSLAGASTRRIEDVSEALWGASVSSGTVSNLNEKALGPIDGWRNRPLACECRYVYVDGVYLKRAWGGAFENEEAGASKRGLKGWPGERRLAGPQGGDVRCLGIATAL